MDVGLNLAVDERLAALLKSLGISRVHIATGFAPNGVAMAPCLSSRKGYHPTLTSGASARAVVGFEHATA